MIVINVIYDLKFNLDGGISYHKAYKNIPKYSISFVDYGNNFPSFCYFDYNLTDNLHVLIKRESDQRRYIRIIKFFADKKTAKAILGYYYES